MSKLVEIGRIYDSSEAFAIKGYLKSHDIDCEVFDESLNTTLWYYQLATGGSRVMVHESDKEKALQLLNEVPKNDPKAHKLMPNTKARWGAAAIFFFSIFLPAIITLLVVLYSFISEL